MGSTSDLPDRPIEPLSFSRPNITRPIKVLCRNQKACEYQTAIGPEGSYSAESWRLEISSSIEHIIQRLSELCAPEFTKGRR